jgi:hypothetical protein
LADTVARDPGALAQSSAAGAGGPPAAGSYTDDIKNFYNRNISPSGIQEAAQPQAMQAGNTAVTKLLSTNPGASQAAQDMVFKKAFEAATPGILGTYGPMVGAGLGIMGLAGGFQAKQPQLSDTAQQLLDRDAGRPTIESDPEKFYVQGLPGVKYDEKGKIIGSAPWSPSTSMDDVRVPAKSTLGGIGLPPLYTPPPGAIGQPGPIEQPYNSPYMYSNLMQPIRTFAQGGNVNPPMGGLASLAQGGYPRRTGQISGPGTEKSDSIPAMLSDGEFVMTAKAVRGAGKGSRRAGAKKMYDLMHQLERNASRG